MIRITISIVNYKGNKNTKECIESLSKLDLFGIALSVVVVNNSQEGRFSSNLVHNNQFQDKITIIDNKQNLGFSEGHNIVIKNALKNGEEYVLLLNNDTIVDKNLLLELLKALESDKKVGIAVPKIYFAKGYEFHKMRYKKEELGKVFWYAGGIIDFKNVIGFHKGVDEVDNGQYDRQEETEIATGCCMLVKKDVFESIGYFNKQYFLYYEDADFSIRAKKAEYTIIYVPTSVLWHKNASAAGGSGSTLQDYYITRNRLMFGIQYAPIRSKVALLKESITLLFWGRKWQKIGVIDYFFRNFGKGSYNQ